MYSPHLLAGLCAFALLLLLLLLPKDRTLTRFASGGGQQAGAGQGRTGQDRAAGKQVTSTSRAEQPVERKGQERGWI